MSANRAVAIYAFQNPVTSDLEKTGVPDHMAAAILLGQELARRGVTVVTGGMRDGLMGLVATAALQAGGHVIGVIPEDFPAEDRHPDIRDIHIVKDGYERKRLMMQLSDASITMAGGVGTCAEYYNEADIMKEVGKGYAVAKKYGVSVDRPVILFDPTSGKFHSPIRALTENMGAVKRNSKDTDSLIIVTNVRQALLATKIISQEDYDGVYSLLGKQLGLSSREGIDAEVKPISPLERRHEFRRAAHIMMGGLTALFLAGTAPRMVPGALDGPYARAVATIQAAGQQVPNVSEAEYRSISLANAERRYNGFSLRQDTSQGERRIFDKMDRLASMPAPSLAESASANTSLAMSLAGMFSLCVGALVGRTARRRPSIVVPRLAPANPSA